MNVASLATSYYIHALLLGAACRWEDILLSLPQKRDAREHMTHTKIKSSRLLNSTSLVTITKVWKNTQ